MPFVDRPGTASQEIDLFVLLSFATKHVDPFGVGKPPFSLTQYACQGTVPLLPPHHFSSSSQSTLWHSFLLP